MLSFNRNGCSGQPEYAETEAKKAGLYSPTDPKDNSALNYHLYVKLIESYVHEYQTLKALNRFMEEKIADVKKQIEEKK